MSTGTKPTPAQVWSAGDYADVCDRMIPELGARLVSLAGVDGGESVLDVAAGSGNAALPAARAGAAVTALDITPALLEIGERRAAADALEVTWVLGDAQALPFADATFDCVLSCVGVQFCADRAAAAAELARVCRPGGRIALIAWTPEGFLGRVLAMVARATGAGSPPPALAWGDEDRVAELLGRRPGEIAFTREHVTMPAPSAAAWVDYMAAAYGPLVMARNGLSARGAWDPLRAELVELAETHDAGQDGAFAVRAEYLASVTRP
ncbi:MAG: class I SAM-dependent methyltransferase [Acidimicrobiales bacterium]